MPSEFKMIITPLNLEKGSKPSLDLVKAIEECEVQEVFSSELLQKIIDYKWQQIRYLNYFSIFV